MFLGSTKASDESSHRSSMSSQLAHGSAQTRHDVTPVVGGASTSRRSSTSASTTRVKQQSNVRQQVLWFFYHLCSTLFKLTFFFRASRRCQHCSCNHLPPALTRPQLDLLLRHRSRNQSPCSCASTVPPPQPSTCRTCAKISGGLTNALVLCDVAGNSCCSSAGKASSAS